MRRARGSRPPNFQDPDAIPYEESPLLDRQRQGPAEISAVRRRRGGYLPGRLDRRQPELLQRRMGPVDQLGDRRRQLLLDVQTAVVEPRYGIR